MYKIYKIHFRKQPPFIENLYPLSVWYLPFVWNYAGSLAIRPRLPCFHTSNKYGLWINNLKTITLTIESISAISLSSQRPRCFNNVILHLNQINKIKNAVVIRNYFGKSSPFVQRLGNLLCQSAWENQGNSWLTSTKTQVSTTKKKPFEGAC